MSVGELRKTSRWQRGRKYVKGFWEQTDRTSIRWAIDKDGDEIVEEVPGGRARSYDPTDEDKLLESLIEVATGFATPAEFASEWGRLGLIDTTVQRGGEEVEEGDLVPDDYLRAVTPKGQKKYLSQFSPWEGSESVRYILAHARTVKAAHELIGHLKAKNVDALRDALKEFPKTQYALLARLSGYWEFEWVPEYAEHDLHAAAHAAISALINPNLRGVQHELQRDERGELRYALTYQTLAQTIYWKLALSIEDKLILWRNCKKCGKLFKHTDPRLRYCPRTAGKARSECLRKAMKEEFKNRWPDGKSRRPWRVKRKRIKA